MVEVKLILERLIGVGHLDGIEVAAKQILGEGEFEGVLVGKFADDGGQSLKAGEARGTPAALPHYELEAAFCRDISANEDRLYDAAGPY
jgi:hypothetical protein